MQDRYAGDIGDFVKFALLHRICEGRKLGVAWYLYPDEVHDADGRHIAYLSKPGNWRALDAVLFDSLKQVSDLGRSVRALQIAGFLDAIFSSEPTLHPHYHLARSKWRERWFERVLSDLKGCTLVFADPDNRLTDDNSQRRSRKIFGKSMSLSEVRCHRGAIFAVRKTLRMLSPVRMCACSMFRNGDKRPSPVAPGPVKTTENSGHPYEKRAYVDIP